MATTPKEIRTRTMGYIPQMNDFNIGHLPRKEQKQIVLRAAAQRKANKRG